jgi:glycosyltransferase involved in cell wall biosynthesis
MVRRRTILIPTSGSYKNSASMIIYLLNILKGLKNIKNDNLIPNIILYHDNDTPLDEFKNINYPYINYFNFKKDVNIFIRLFNFFYKKFFNKHIFKTYNHNIDIVFPAMLDNTYVNAKRLIFWKADFQEKYLPQFFTKNDLEYSDTFFENLNKYTKSTLVLSSKDALNSYKLYYPNHKNPTFVLPFVSFIESNNDLDFNIIKSKFDIRKPYFIICNQFWPHKNHIRVLEALNILNSNNVNFQILFTGNTSSYRNENIFNDLKLFIENNNLNSSVIITGFIERDEQVSLIENSLAVIQPSYFEGWSTVIEDAKALNKYVIASNINVNLEQIKDDCIFFNPDDATELSNIMYNFSIDYNLINRNYKNDIDAFSNKLIELFNLNDK